MKPRSAKAKGRSFQQWVRDALLGVFSDLKSDDIRSTSMGASGEDLLLSPAARGRFPYSVECKSRRAIAVYGWLEQRDGEGYPPIVFAKANRRSPLVILYADDFLKLLKEIDGIKKAKD